MICHDWWWMMWCHYGSLTRYIKPRVVHAPECREHFPRWLQRKPLVSDPDMHHGTCVTHVPWCMLGSLTRGGRENNPGIPGTYTTRNFTYLARCPWCLCLFSEWCNREPYILPRFHRPSSASRRHKPTICPVLCWIYGHPTRGSASRGCDRPFPWPFMRQPDDVWKFHQGRRRLWLWRRGNFAREVGVPVLLYVLQSEWLHQWRHVSIHRKISYLFNNLWRLTIKKTNQSFTLLALCEGNPADSSLQRARNAESISILISSCCSLSLAIYYD